MAIKTEGAFSFCQLPLSINKNANIPGDPIQSECNMLPLNHPDFGDIQELTEQQKEKQRTDNNRCASPSRSTDKT